MDVESILSAEKQKYKTTKVEKIIPLSFDLGNLAAFDINSVDETKLASKDVEDYISSLCRDNSQLLFNEIFSLPMTTNDAGVFARLPPTTFPLPREKKLPAKDAAPQTKWAKFAAAKGIKKKKRDAKVYDETTGEAIPRHGRKSAANREDWCIELPDNPKDRSVLYEDHFQKKKQEKKERTAKNKANNERNRRNAETVSKKIKGKKAK